MKKSIKITLAIIFISFSIFLGKDKILAIPSIQNNDNQTRNNSNIITNLILVNNDNKLDKTYKPKEIKIPSIPFINESTDEEKQMEGVAAKAIENLVEQARNEGINFLGTSAYRSYQSQEKVYKSRIKSQGIKKANEYVAKPGESEHQTGLCIDVTNEDRWFVESTKEAMWLADNAHKFGFILRYPKGKEDVTGKSYEPWHIRYVGEKVAKEIYEQGLTLEEYIENE